MALNLRTSITALSPVLDAVSGDFPMGTAVIAGLGILPPATFALFGILGSRLALRLSLEWCVILALVVSVAGHVLRALSGSAPVLIIATFVSLAGMGTANVLLPPLVKRYFAGRESAVTSLYATLIGVSTALPALLAVPVTQAVGWRGSVGSWGVVAIVAIIPWIALVFTRGIAVRRREQPVDLGVLVPDASVRSAIWRSPQAWALGIVFSVSAMNGYAIFAWLPTMLADLSGLSAIESGLLLSLYAALGIPLALAIPTITQRTGRPGLVLTAGMVFTIVGNLGLVALPSLPWLWVTLAGLGPLLFPACLTLFALRARTEEGAVALSGFSQGVGYLLGLLGPLIVGALYELTGEWMLSLVFLAAVAIPGLFAARIIARSGEIESEMDGRATLQL